MKTVDTPPQIILLLYPALKLSASLEYLDYTEVPVHFHIWSWVSVFVRLELINIILALTQVLNQRCKIMLLKTKACIVAFSSFINIPLVGH